MEVTAGAMRALLPKLAELLKDEYNLEKHVREGVKSLEIELTMMHAALRKVAEVPLDQLDDQVKIWASKVREISYDVEDAVDAIMVRVEDDSHSGPSTFKNRVKRSIKKISKLFRKAKELHQIADAIKEAQALAQQMAGLRERYSGLELQNSGVAATIDPRLTALYIDVTDLVGIDHAREELIKILTEGEDSSKQQLKIISIVGFGGLGKTILARVVHEKIEAQFDCSAFVSVSRNPDVRMIFKKMLHQLEKVKYANINESSRDETQLIDELREFLQDKSKYAESHTATYVGHELSMQIGKLEFLQTLDLVGSRINKLPATIVQLRRLMCLCVSFDTRLPDKLGEMTSLEELSSISTSKCVDIVKELRQLTRLRVLAIEWEELGEKQDKALVECLGSLHRLQILNIYAFGGCLNLMQEGWMPPVSLRRFLSKGSTGSFSTLPTWINPLLLITCIDMWVDQVRPWDIQILGELPALCSVSLRATGSIEERVVEIFVVSTNAFQRARECTFFNFVTVPSMFPLGAMPRVRYLEFSLRAWDNDMAIGNGSSGDLDLAMGHLPSLERVSVMLWCTKASRAEVEGVEAALRRATDVHPNNPTLAVRRWDDRHIREQENNLADKEDDLLEEDDEKESSPPSVTTDM